MNGTGFGWILLACIGYGVFHSWLASHTVKRRAAGIVGKAAYQRFYRLFFSITGTVTALPLLALVALLPDKHIYTIGAPWVYGTLLVQGLAALALLLGVMQTGVLAFLGIKQALARDPANSAPDKLVVGGLYRWVRHPLYTAGLLLIWLTPLMTWNVLALNLGLTLYFLIGSVFEERKLIQQFGKAYGEYRARTPWILPSKRSK
jgi:protein-S-isoprenylcysteine O-methyltransferase Ste14